MNQTRAEQSAKNVKPVVDWALAASTGAFLVRGGPALPRAEAEQAVAELRKFSLAAESHVREVTGLGAGLPLLPGEVVDRPGWVRAVTSGLDALTSVPLAEGRTGPFGPLLARGAGLQTGAVLAFLASRVLGQYDPFGGSDHEGSLLLVAPNIVAAQQSMKVSGEDFRLWVCLHESTHRLQFTAVPWLRRYFQEQVHSLISDVTGGDEQRLAELVGRLPEALRNARSRPRDGGPLLTDLLGSPEQRAVLDRLIALSTLLEGHADYVMDAVGPEVVPTVNVIRQRFTERRKGRGPLDRIMRSLFGLDAKMRQYAQGAEFTRQVIGQVGMTGFNKVWDSPESLPLRAEIVDPQTWIRRVHD